MKTVIGIDVGGSTTKIVGFRRDENGERVLVESMEGVKLLVKKSEETVEVH